MDPLIFERGDKLYIVAPVTPIGPGAAEIEEFAFAQQMQKLAPNENLKWLRGQYVEADRPNANGQMWSAGELSIKSLTPMFMPVTVMHDPRTAVGLIADTKLLTPAADQVARSRIDTTMGIWQHRFPEVAEEIDHNYTAGSLMQSMECISPHYECSACGQVFQKLPDGAERRSWCEHLQAAERATAVQNDRAGRILGNVVFTGTGLIFGTRGARGAYDEAHLDVFQDEVAEFHTKTHIDGKRKRPRSRTKMEIDDSRYQELLAAEEKAKQVPDLEKRAQDAEEARDQAVKDHETAETAQKAAEQERDDLKTKVDEAEETARKGDLRDERLGKLGKDFKAKLGEKTTARLRDQAADMSDEDWTARLEELAEITGVKSDAGGTGDPDNNGNGGGKDETEFSAEEVARAGVGRIDAGGEEPSTEKRQSVVSGLYDRAAGKKTPDDK